MKCMARGDIMMAAVLPVFLLYRKLLAGFNHPRLFHVLKCLDSWEILVSSW